MRPKIFLIALAAVVSSLSCNIHADSNTVTIPSSTLGREVTLTYTRVGPMECIVGWQAASSYFLLQCR